MSKGGVGRRGFWYAVGTWGYMGIGGSLGNYAVSIQVEKRAGGEPVISVAQRESPGQGYRGQCTIVRRTTRRRSRGGYHARAAPVTARSGNLLGIGIQALTP